MAGQSSAMIGSSWTDVSVLGSQVFWQALMDSCGKSCKPPSLIIPAQANQAIRLTKEICMKSTVQWGMMDLVECPYLPIQTNPRKKQYQKKYIYPITYGINSRKSAMVVWQNFPSSFWVLSQFECLKFCHNLIFWVLSQFEFLVLSQFVFLSVVIIWFFEFCHNFHFWVLSWFDFLSFVTTCVFEFCHNVNFEVLSLFEFFSFVTISFR